MDTNKKLTDELKKYTDELKKKLTKYEFDLDDIMTFLKQVMVQIKKSSPDKIKSPKDHNTTTMVPDNKDASIFEGGKLFKNG